MYGIARSFLMAPVVVEPGGGIVNGGGFVEIVNSTIAKNQQVGNPGQAVEVYLIVVAGWFPLSTARFGRMKLVCCGWPFESKVVVLGTMAESYESRTPLLRAIPSIAHLQVGPDCFGTITSLGNNLVGDPSGCDINLQPSDLTGDPGLGSLVGAGEDDLPGKAFYSVLAGSPVIDRGNPNACLQTDQLGNLRVGICDIGAVEFRGPVLVSVDVRPKKDANRINPNSTKNINVAIFSVNGFDATTVDANTVRFGATGTEAAPVHVAIRDVNGDGHLDMVLRFQIPDTGIKCGDTSASLTGQISNGLSIIGSSPIKTVQCKQPKVSRN